MRYPPQLLDEIRARLPVSQVVARKVKLKKAGRELVGLSPFKVEKTPSFYVNDHKGFYHCFSSGEHGDIFAFLMKTEGLTFPQAVERLAQEAGVELPKREARSTQRQEGHARLLFLMEAAAKFFEESLAARSGSPGASYAEKRGLSSNTIKEFRIGYAPNGRYELKQHLAKKGFSVREMITAGVLIAGDDIPVPYDRFRHRLMFPIQDARGRVIAFGGRALDPDQQPKYLNSPETPLFRKGHVLFNLHRARAAAHDKRRMIVVEGYMDVVGLAQSGITEAVAPLGTALSEEQCRLLWRFTGVPVLLFDGDSAGLRAAHRAIDVALPHLAAGMSLAFATLPVGADPDELVRAGGPDAIEAVLSSARPMIDVLFEREWAVDQWQTPEKRAELERTFRHLTSKIQDRIVREHYEADIAARLRAVWGRGEAQQWRRYREKPKPQSLSITSVPWPHREMLLITQLIRHPWLIEEHAEQISEMPVSVPELARLRDAILAAAAIEPQIGAERLTEILRNGGHDETLARLQVKIADAHKQELAAVEAGWLTEMALHRRANDLKREIHEAAQDWVDKGSDEAFQRIQRAKLSLEQMRSEEKKI